MAIMFVLTSKGEQEVAETLVRHREGGWQAYCHGVLWKPTLDSKSPTVWDRPPTDEQLGQIMGSIDAHLDLLERYPSAGTSREQGCDDCLSGEWPARHLTTDCGMVGPPCWCHYPKGD